MEHLSDEELLNRYFEGDAQAFRCFVKRHSGRVVAYAQAKGLRMEIAVEVAQESFLKLHRFIHKYEQGRPALPWFFTIVHHCVIDAFRETNPKEHSVTSEVLDSFALGSTDHSGDYSKNPDEVDTILRGLTEEQREIIKLRVLDGLSFKEIASSTGKTETSLRKIYERARRLLKSKAGGINQ